MKKNQICISTFVFLFLCSTLTFAQTPPASGVQEPPSEVGPADLRCGLCEAAESHNFSTSAPGKIGRGLVNILLGWTNLFTQPVHAGSSGGNLWSGIGKGFNYFFLRTVQGVTELGVFWLPPAKVEGLKHCTLGDWGVTQR
ncbi:MAG: hypothetical protein A3C35_00540 [Omnitrophica bacterium RIFCSPHIGHO2_02_FULL_46_11]|nr:MAG: hypothetical protein A3C35_00540 [Omnitrophica bacterium RIFCSPHIGHO2_02_FULL_46_11]OGW88014.1 MAG: hypothetical protein A3A81_06735 [Omnitrophica bacterium RIFCSPLOWO2_01_FULL_45_10b]